MRAVRVQHTAIVVDGRQGGARPAPGADLQQFILGVDFTASVSPVGWVYMNSGSNDRKRIGFSTTDFQYYCLDLNQ